MILRKILVILCFSLVFVFGGCGNGRNEISDSGFVQMVNPLVMVDSVQEMEKRLGYEVPVLEKSIDSCIVLVIDNICESGRIRYADGSDFNIKQGTGDISGIYRGILETEENVNGVAVSFFTFEEIRYAIWETNGFTYSLTGGADLRENVAVLIAGRDSD